MRVLRVFVLLVTPVCGFAQHQVIATKPTVTLTQEQAAALRGAFEKKTYQGLPYRQLTPPRSNTKFPLVVMYHGSGTPIGTDNESQLGNLALTWAQPSVRTKYPAYVIVPQFPARSASYETSAADHMMASHADPPLQMALALIEHLIATEPIDPSRVYVMGFSMGGSTTYHSILQRPNLFAAGIALSGVPPERATAEKFRNIPMLICHGDVDTENPYAPDFAMYQAIAREKNRVIFRTYTGMEHQAPPDFFDPNEIWWRDWLFGQRR